jgi:hypothetical protein
MNLEDRIIRVEAELAIRNVIARYGLAADCGDIATALACHTTEAVYVVSNPRAGREGETGDLELKGHQAIANMLTSDMHQSLLPNCAHTVGPLVVEVEGDSAQVTGYSRVYHKQKLMRVAVNQWTMRMDIGTWKIAHRESRLVGEEAAQKLLRESLNGF